MLTGLCSGVVGLATAIPMSKGSFLISDGARVLRLARGRAPAARDAALLQLEALSVGKTHPREWDDAVVATALLPADASAGECIARQMAYLVAVDRGDGDQAYEHLAKALELIDTLPGSAAAPLAAEAAYFEGWWRGRADEARRWLGRLPASSPFLPAYERLRAEAAALAAAGETSSSRARVEEALRLAPAAAVSARDRLTEMQNRLEEFGLTPHQWRRPGAKHYRPENRSAAAMSIGPATDLSQRRTRWDGRRTYLGAGPGVLSSNDVQPNRRPLKKCEDFSSSSSAISSPILTFVSLTGTPTNRSPGVPSRVT